MQYGCVIALTSKSPAIGSPTIDGNGDFPSETSSSRCPRRPVCGPLVGPLVITGRPGPQRRSTRPPRTSHPAIQASACGPQAMRPSPGMSPGTCRDANCNGQATGIMRAMPRDARGRGAAGPQGGSWPAPAASVRATRHGETTPSTRSELRTRALRSPTADRRAQHGRTRLLRQQTRPLARRGS